MDEDTAKTLFVDGGTLLFLDVPAGTEFGIDMKSWNTGENFRGVKMIPPGIHYIFYNPVGLCGDVAPRIGFFHNFKKSEVLVKKWDQINEDNEPKGVNEAEIVKLRENMIMFDKFLGPYPYDVLDKWRYLTSHINENLIKSLSPLSGMIRSALELLSCNDHDRPRLDKNIPGCSSKDNKRTRFSLNCNPENIFLPDLKPVAGTELRLTIFPEIDYPEGSTPAEITQHCLDLSYVFESLMSKYANNLDIVGELEFTYICFLVGHSLEAFEHWKKLFTLFCSCELAIKKFRAVYDAFITLLDEQIKQLPEEFLFDILTNSNFVYLMLRKLFRSVSESDVDGRLKSKVERFKNGLSDLYSWDFTNLESDNEEDLPVIVDVDI